MLYAILIIIGLIIASVVMIVNAGKRAAGRESSVSHPAQATTDEPFIRTGFLDAEANDVYIAGLAHHCTRKDVGFFTGVIYNEKDNAYDKNAMAIGNHQTKKVVGYVPAAILSEYRSWCRRKDCPCVGYIFFDGDALRGRVRSYPKEMEQAKVIEDAQEYARQICTHFGWPVPDLS